MKKGIRVGLVLFALTTSLQAQEWIDLTEDYVVNPSFDGSIDGWTDDFDGAAQNHGFQNAYYSNGAVWISQFAEAWRDKNSYDWMAGGRQLLGDAAISQRLTSLPSGKFRLEADAIAVDQLGKNNPVSGVLLFLESSTNLATTTIATGDGKPEHFSVELTDYTGSLTIGVRTQNATANWLAFDNVQLFWYGVIVEPTSIKLSNTGKTLQLGETFQLTATVSPSDATYRKVVFSSDDMNVASVTSEGLVTGVGGGTTRVRVRMADPQYTFEATCIVTVKGGVATAGSLVVNEVQQANVDQFIDPSWNFGGWVELYNTTDEAISLAGLYVSDDPADPLKMPLDSRFGVVPAKGFKALWFDHYSRWAPSMVNFKLDTDGGTFCLAKGDGTVILQQSYPPAIARTSYARSTDGGNAWGYTDSPTPEATNATSSFAQMRLAAPVVDKNGGFFTSSFTARVTIPTGATLRYTTDGSTPTLTNGKTSTDGRFSIDGTMVLRLRLFQSGWLASPVTTRSFIYRDRDYTLPVVSIVSDPANLTGRDYGIFVRGNGNGRPGNGQSSACNWNMEWDRPANLEFFTEDGQSAFNQEVGIEASGGWSRAWEPHSFNIKTGKIYEGLNRMDYQFFENKPFLRHKALKVRNGGNDVQNNGARIKDAAIQEVVRTSGLYVETQSYRPVHVFHNGVYIGLENLREPNSKNYAYANYGIDTDEQDQWKMSPDSGYVQQEGTRDSWDELVTLSYQSSDPVIYNMICDRLDIEGYINYCAVELYIAGTDWPKNNIKAFRDNTNGGSNARFRFVLFDTDGAFATDNAFSWFENCNWWTYDQLYGVSDLYPSGRISGEIEFVTLLRNLWVNETFKKQFVDQFCIVAGSVFEPTRAAEVINAMVSYVRPAMNLEGLSTNSANSVRNSLSASRQTSSVRNMRNYLGLSDAVKLTLSSDLAEARLQMNGLDVPTGKFAGQVFLPITVKASAPAGYVFDGWSSNLSTSSKAVFEKGSTWDYYDQGSLDGENWKALNYTNHWSTGYAPLGYDTGNSTKAAAYGTTLSYGDNSQQKYPTYYFRKTINLSTAPKASDLFTLDWVADDGFVIYVNGTEAGRFLMDKTPNPTFSSLADTYANANPESGQMTLDASLFRKGSNLIAVELHNNSVTSTDIYWDAALLQSTEVEGSYVSTDEEYTLPANATDLVLKAVYTPLDSQDRRGWDAHPVKINEVSAANDIFVSDLFKKSDWIELYNTTDEAYDIAGMYLSDHLTEPEKWQVPTSDGSFSTVIPAHGHLVIWCDKTAGSTQLHADFKLNNEDKSLILLTAKDKTWADTLVYCAHDGFHTVGLYPDGGSSLYVMERPTIGSVNLLTTTASLWPEPQPDIEVNISSDEKGDVFQLAFTGTALLLQGNVPSARLDIYSVGGQLLLTRRIKADSAVDVSALPAGIYVANATAGEQQTTLKFTKR